jgi:hypothetical protein
MACSTSLQSVQHSDCVLMTLSNTRSVISVYSLHVFHPEPLHIDSFNDVLSCFIDI